MKLKIENWLDNQKFSSNVNSILKEAVVCYKVEAYRASMVMSYIGFQTILKERMLSSVNPPSGINGIKWLQILTVLQNEDKWDEQVKDAVQMKAPSPIFLISDGLRGDVTYWKDRRNDCAHYKTNDINYYNIEAFWGFMEVNLPKLMINGGLGALINKIETHFDISKTPVGQDFIHLVKEIAKAIKPTELQSFFIEINTVFNRLGLNIKTQLEFYNEIFVNCNSDIKTALTSFLKTTPTLLIDFLRNKPNRINEFSFDSVFVRNLWYMDLFVSGKNDFNVYCELLDKGIIPIGDVEEANTMLLERMYDVVPSNNHEGNILKTHGFFEQLKKRIIDDGELTQFAYSNDRAGLITYYFENYTLTNDTVNRICNVFSTSLNPHELGALLNKLFSENLNKKTEFKEICKSEGYTLPIKINALNT